MIILGVNTMSDNKYIYIWKVYNIIWYDTRVVIIYTRPRCHPSISRRRIPSAGEKTMACTRGSAPALCVENLLPWMRRKTPLGNPWYTCILKDFRDETWQTGNVLLFILPLTKLIIHQPAKNEEGVLTFSAANG